MKKPVFLLPILATCLSLGLIFNNETSSVSASGEGATLLFSPGTPKTDYWYNYCPSVMEEKDGTRHIYYCTNKVKGNVTDYIGYRKGTRNQDGTYTWGEQSIVLSPTSGAWDSRHNCDPSIIKGSFNYNSTNYQYLLAYLGCSSSDSSDNEVGIAVSNSPAGPFTKIPGQFRPFTPVDSTGAKWEWGTGQPSIVSIDKQGKVFFTYTIGDLNATRIVAETWDLSNLNNPTMIGNSVRISTNGLTQKDGTIDYVLNNADFAYDPVTQRMYMIRDGHPNHTVNPSVSDTAQICYADFNPNSPTVGGNISNTTAWKLLKQINPSDTGLERNHNTALVRDEYGHIPNHGNLTAILSSGTSYGTSKTWPELSSYRLYSYEVPVGFPSEGYQLDVGVNVSYVASESQNVVWWRQQLIEGSQDMSSGNSIAIRIKNNTGINTPIRIAFNCTSNYRYRAFSNNDSSKLFYLLDKNGNVTSSPYRTWDGDVIIPFNFNGWLIMKKSDQVTDTSYGNEGTFTWSSIYGVYYGIENYKNYDAYANYDIGDVYTANLEGNKVTFVKPIFQCGFVDESTTTTNFALDYLGTGNINIVRNNPNYIPVVAFLNKLMTIDTCSTSFSTGYKAYKNILNNFYSKFSSDPIYMGYYQTTTLLDYQDGDRNHEYGLVREINAQEKWETIIRRYTSNSIYARPTTLIAEDSNIMVLVIILATLLVLGGITIYKTKSAVNKNYNK